jgi:hypothetical protein
VALKLHPDVFRKLANWMPKSIPGCPTGAERLQNAGGITVSTVQLLHDYACWLVGLEPGSSALVYIKGPPSGYLWFGESIEAGDGVEGALYTEVRLAGHDPFFIYSAPPSPGHERGTLRFEHEAGPVVATPQNRVDISGTIADVFAHELGGADLMFLTEKL